MTFVDLFAIAVAVAMDAVAVSLAQGIRLRRPRVRDALVVAAFFGAFQGLMPLAGWALSSRFASVAAAFGPWVAFALLAAVGVHMLREALTDAPDDDAARTAATTGSPTTGPTTTLVAAPARPALRTLTVLAFATSVDALAVGVGLGLVDAPVGTATGLMAAVTFVLSTGAVLAGARLGERLGRRAEVAGGVVLIVIGLRVLVTHLLGA